jgi:hypothetical protein
MGPESNACGIVRKHKRGCTAKQLSKEPDANKYHGGDRQKKRYDKNWDERDDCAFGEHYHIGCHDSRYGTGCTNGRNWRIAVQYKMGKRGNKPAQNVKQEIPDLTHPVFYIITENEEDPHIGNQVSPSAMQKHICKKRPEYIDPELMKIGYSGQADIVRN